jgi:colanic acid/amylovoran biosynthesis glycosyltransferase
LEIDKPPPHIDDSRPVVAHYCATFLRPEMLHVYRQICGIERFRSIVLARKREEEDRFPFRDVILVPKPFSHELQRFWSRNVRDEPLQITPSEIARITAALKKSNARLLHIYFGHIGVLLLPLIKVRPVPIVVSFHGADVMVQMNKPSFRLATETMLGAVDLVLVRSESLGERLIALGCNKGKIRIHRTGIPLDKLSFRQRHSPRDGRWRLIQACRLIEKKGLPVTLHAFARFCEDYPESRLTIAGNGPLLPNLKELASDLGLRERVEFPGFLSQEELRSAYYESHLFTHPSELGKDGNQEGVPNSMLEAMATGLPVLATKHGGIPEAVKSNVSGILVDEGDHKALAHAMLKLAGHEAKYEAMSEAARRAVANKFDLRAQVAVLESFYQEALGERT